MTIAFPILEGQRLGHLGEARQFALVEADPQTHSVLRSQIIGAPPHEPGSFPRWLREQGAQAVIVAGIGQRALDNLVHHGIEVQVGPSGAPVMELVAGYLAGHLRRAVEGCDQQHDEAAAAHECQLAAYLEDRPAEAAVRGNHESEK